MMPQVSGKTNGSASSASSFLPNPPSSSKSSALSSHASLKGIRGRGMETPSHLAAFRYLRSLEAELVLVQNLVRDAWNEIDKSKDYRKFLRHTDQAQQRLHQAIKRLVKNV